MPKFSDVSVPSYRLHKQSGQAIVTLNKRDVLLGAHGSASSKAPRAEATELQWGRSLMTAEIWPRAFRFPSATAQNFSGIFDPSRGTGEAGAKSRLTDSSARQSTADMGRFFLFIVRAITYPADARWDLRYICCAVPCDWFLPGPVL